MIAAEMTANYISLFTKCVEIVKECQLIGLGACDILTADNPPGKLLQLSCVHIYLAYKWFNR